jgi:integrase
VDRSPRRPQFVLLGDAGRRLDQAGRLLLVRNSVSAIASPLALIACSSTRSAATSMLRRSVAATGERRRPADRRPLRVHDLRHSFGSLVIREFDPVSVKDFMGHAKIMTTERSVHARSRRIDAARMTKAFAAGWISSYTVPAPT